MLKKNTDNIDEIPYDDFIIKSFDNFLLKCKKIYNREVLISSKHLLYWIIRKMRKEGVEESDLLDYIKECSNQFSEQKEEEEIARIEKNIDQLNNTKKT